MSGLPARGVALITTVIALTAAGCGGGEEPSGKTRPAEPGGAAERSTGESRATAPATTADQPGPGPPAGGSGGAAAPAPKASQPQDSPRHDVPPPRGSPAERFERACERDPAVCE